MYIYCAFPVSSAVRNALGKKARARLPSSFCEKKEKKRKMSPKLCATVILRYCDKKILRGSCFLPLFLFSFFFVVENALQAMRSKRSKKERNETYSCAYVRCVRRGSKALCNDRWRRNSVHWNQWIHR